MEEVDVNNIEEKVEERDSSSEEMPALATAKTFTEILGIQQMPQLDERFYHPDGRKKKIGVNEKCPCGSGKKYKKCCREI